MSTKLLEPWLQQYTSKNDTVLSPSEILSFPHRLQVCKFLYYNRNTNPLQAIFEVSDGLHTIQAAFSGDCISKYERENDLLISRGVGMLILLKQYSFEIRLNNSTTEISLELTLFNLISPKNKTVVSEKYQIWLNINEFFSFSGEGVGVVNADNLSPLAESKFFRNYFETLCGHTNDAFSSLIDIINNTKKISISEPNQKFMLDMPLEPETDEAFILLSDFLTISDTVINKIVDMKGYYWTKDKISTNVKNEVKTKKKQTIEFTNTNKLSIKKSTSCPSFSAISPKKNLTNQETDEHETSTNIKHGLHIINKIGKSTNTTEKLGSKNDKTGNTQTQVAPYNQTRVYSYNSPLNRNSNSNPDSNPSWNESHNTDPDLQNSDQDNMLIDTDAWIDDYIARSGINTTQTQTQVYSQTPLVNQYVRTATGNISTSDSYWKARNQITLPRKIKGAQVSTTSHRNETRLKVPDQNKPHGLIIEKANFDESFPELVNKISHQQDARQQQHESEKDKDQYDYDCDYSCRHSVLEDEFPVLDKKSQKAPNTAENQATLAKSHILEPNIELRAGIELELEPNSSSGSDLESIDGKRKLGGNGSNSSIYSGSIQKVDIRDRSKRKKDQIKTKPSWKSNQGNSDSGSDSDFEYHSNLEFDQELYQDEDQDQEFELDLGTDTQSVGANPGNLVGSLKQYFDNSESLDLLLLSDE